MHDCGNQPYKKLANRKKLQRLPGLFTTMYKRVMEKTGSKDYYFAGFFRHPMLTTSLLMHAYRYPLFKSKAKQVCKPLLYAEKI